MRGSSLAWPASLEQLRPFVVTSWTGRSADDLPDEIRALYHAAGLKQRHVNFALFVLDEQGQFLRGVQPAIRPPAFQFNPEAQGRDFARQLNDLLAGLPVPRRPATTALTLTLPDVEGAVTPTGVRIFLSFSANRLNHHRTPTVEAVPLADDLRKALVYPRKEGELPAAVVRSWLEQIYPPAIMDGKGAFRSLTGKLRFGPAAGNDRERWAIVRGKVQFVMDNSNRTEYSGDLEMALRYDGERLVQVRGICACNFPKQNPEGRVVETFRMLAAIESLPD